MDYLEQLNETQREAVIHNGPPLLILAGAGSGKTRVITTKIAFLIDQFNYNPQSILAVTFTNKAAREMRERAVSLSPLAASTPLCTFHSFGASFLRRYSDMIGLDREFNILDDNEAVLLLRKLFPEQQASVCRELYRTIQQVKDNVLTQQEEIEQLSTIPDFYLYYQAYQQRMKEISCVDFGDLIIKPLQALEENEALRKKIHRKYKAILVDEYQDTNIAQYQLLQVLKGEDSYLCAVGDEDQSIYAFRGAEVQNILTFKESFPQAEVIRLEQNYRSTGRILQTANSVISYNRERLGKNLWTANVEEGICQLHYLDDDRQEAEFCAKILEDGDWEQSAILYRTNAQAAIFEQVLRQRHISYTTLGTMGFFEHVEIKDVLAFLRLLLNPKDFPAFQRIVNRPPRGVGERRLDKIVEISKSCHDNLLEAARVFCEREGKNSALMDFLDFFDETLADSYFKIGDVIDQIYKRFELKEFYEKADKASGSSVDREDNLKALKGLSVSCDLGREGLRAFLDSLALDSSQGEEKESVGVKLATIHNTKGLEFDRVFVVGVEDGILPSIRTENIEEERRLFYVAVTRARKALYLTTVKKRFRFGRLEYQAPSPFLSELDQEAVTLFKDVDEEQTEFPIGAIVFHERYGKGQVLNCIGSGSQQMIQIYFEDGIQRKILPRFSPIEVIDREGYMYD